MNSVKKFVLSCKVQREAIKKFPGAYPLAYLKKHRRSYWVYNAHRIFSASPDRLALMRSNLAASDSFDKRHSFNFETWFNEVTE